MRNICNQKLGNIAGPSKTNALQQDKVAQKIKLERKRNLKSNVPQIIHAYISQIACINVKIDKELSMKSAD